MKVFRLISLLAPAIIVGGPAYGHVTGLEHPAGLFHPILGVDHLLIVLGLAVALGLLVAWRR